MNIRPREIEYLSWYSEITMEMKPVGSCVNLCNANSLYSTPKSPDRSWRPPALLKEGYFGKERKGPRLNTCGTLSSFCYALKVHTATTSASEDGQAGKKFRI